MTNSPDTRAGSEISRRSDWRGYMQKFLLILILMTLGEAFAQSTLRFGFDDSDFTYFGSEEGFLSLTYEEDRLIMHLSDQPSDMWLRFDKVKTPKTTDMDGEGQVSYSEAKFRADPQKRLTLAKLVRCEVARNRADISHENARMNAVMATYQEALTLLGFELETNAARGSIRDMVFAHEGGQRLRVSFSRGFDEGHSFVKVRMTPA